MKFRQTVLTIFAVIASSVCITAAFAQSTTTRVRMTTSMGVMVLELDSARAPLTVKNFLEYVQAGHYNGTIFHRVIPGFVIQGGGYTRTEVEKPTRASVVNEAGNGLSNRHGTLAMARTGDPHSATAQFYINLADNVQLDPQPGRWGYTVFGKVVEGINVAQKIGEVATGSTKTLEDAPVNPILIEKMEVVQ
ncbi:MAG: peptidyl-prolyl cis-trans isomerase [Candidatus Obscuribacterales bacterium]|nr:peptidyl-prolyl cis-trans isomerase [Steroidobacteraceae bacterium]